MYLQIFLVIFFNFDSFHAFSSGVYAPEASRASTTQAVFHMVTRWGRRRDTTERVEERRRRRSTKSTDFDDERRGTQHYSFEEGGHHSSRILEGNFLLKHGTYALKSTVQENAQLVPESACACRIFPSKRAATAPRAYWRGTSHSSMARTPSNPSCRRALSWSRRALALAVTIQLLSREMSEGRNFG